MALLGATVQGGQALWQTMFNEGDAAAAVASRVSEPARVANVVAGLGIISCVWDGYQITQAWEGSRMGAETKLGEALRRIVEDDSKIREGGRGGG